MPSASEESALALEQPAATSPWAVSTENLAVVYRTHFDKKPTLAKSLRRLGRRERIVRQIRALRGVSIDVPRGEVLGIIGANGAGKSTLMRTIAGILPPTEGRVEVRGRVSTLLALGIGFHGALSGRENVYLGGLAAGLTREEVAAKYDDIAEFAELGDFIDVPMRTYSSGMYGRLAFSVAVNVDPDILLIDEALSVGDARFKQKSFARMQELCDQAGTIILVSHGLRMVRKLCTEVVWLHEGKVAMQGEPEAVIEEYTRFLDVRDSDEAQDD